MANLKPNLAEVLLGDDIRASGTWPTFANEDVPRDRETMPAPAGYGEEPPPTVPTPVLQSLLDASRET